MNNDKIFLVMLKKRTFGWLIEKTGSENGNTPPAEAEILADSRYRPTTHWQCPPQWAAILPISRILSIRLSTIQDNLVHGNLVVHYPSREI